jgi:hypothetical protein
VGDGEYRKDRGTWQVRLLEIPLDRSASKCATLLNLGPDWEWTVGVRVEPTGGTVDQMVEIGTSHLRKEFVPQASVALTLSDESNQTIFSVSGPLKDWTWNWNYAYRDGRGEEYQSAPGTYRFRRFDVGPDESWGSHFTPRYSARYSLCYTVERPAPIPQGTVPLLTVETHPGSL